MPNGWNTKAYMQGFDCENIPFENDVNVFECIKIAETIYEGVVEMLTMLVTAGEIEEKLPHKKKYSKIGKCTGKHKQRDVDCLRDRPQLK